MTYDGGRFPHRYTDNGWLANPWLSPNQPTDHSLYRAAGWGDLFYPPFAPNATQAWWPVGAPVTSIRWELMRRGLEDAEAFYQLDQLLARCAPRPGARAGSSRDSSRSPGRLLGEMLANGTAALDGLSVAVWGFPDVPYGNLHPGALDEPYATNHQTFDMAKERVVVALEALQGAACAQPQSGK